MKHISEAYGKHEQLVFVDYRPIKEAFQKSPEERKVFNSIRHELKKMKVDGKSQPSSYEKRKRRIK